jgi:hypothetical protein
VAPQVAPSRHSDAYPPATAPAVRMAFLIIAVLPEHTGDRCPFATLGHVAHPACQPANAKLASSSLKRRVWCRAGRP